MPVLRTHPFHVVCGVLGVFFYCFGFVSYLVKERLYIAEPCMSYTRSNPPFCVVRPNMQMC
jgi:hypothetical protein